MTILRLKQSLNIENIIMFTDNDDD